MKFVVSYHAAKAGCIASMVSEASAPELLLNEFTALQCSSMFHSKPPVVFTDKVHALRKDMQARPLSPRTSARANSLRSDLPCTVSSAPSKEATTFAPTAQYYTLSRREPCGLTWLGYTTCKSHLKNELKLMRDRCAGKAGVRMMSSRVLEEHQLKLDRLTLLAALTKIFCRNFRASLLVALIKSDSLRHAVQKTRECSPLTPAPLKVIS